MNVQATINVLNRKASYEFSFIDKYVAGLILTGTEIKSLRLGKANITDGYCVFINGELIARNIQINEYDKGTHYNHEPKRDRKLLLNKHELKKLQGALKDQGLTIVPLRLFINEKGWAKLEVALAKGKKLFDKRDDIKKKDMQRETDRKFK
ncbi:MAG: SsrA-binding protein SmpB [Bacteroidia bacterium]